jgi:hypothetical protein
MVTVMQILAQTSHVEQLLNTYFSLWGRRSAGNPSCSNQSPSIRVNQKGGEIK